MANNEFKEIYLLYRQQNMTLHDIRIIYGIEKAGEFEREMTERNEAINKAKSYDVKVIHHTKSGDIIGTK